MKHKLNFLFAIILLFSFFSFTSCSNFEKEAEAKAEEFIELFNNQDFDKIASFSENVLESSKKLNKSYSKLDTYSKYNTKITDKGKDKQIIFHYKCTTAEKSDIYLEIVIKKTDNEYIVNSINFDTNKEWFENHELLLEQAEETGESYYKFLNDDKLNNISTLLDKKLIIESGQEEAFIALLEYKTGLLGKIKEHKQVKILSELMDEIPAVILIYECKTDKSTFYEELNLIKREDGFKIINYKNAETIEELL